MIIPCIDLQDGKAVQLVRGRRRALAVEDVLGLLDRFRGYPILHVIDLDAAMRKGSNARWIKRLCAKAKVNVRVGGFYRAPDRRDLDGVRVGLDQARQLALETVVWVAGFPFPDFDHDYQFVSLRHPTDYPIAVGRVVSNRGLDIDVREYDQHFTEVHVPHSTALHSLLHGNGTYLVGPMARYSLNSGQLPATVMAAAGAAGLGATCTNPFRSIIVRAIETLYACEEAIRLIDAYEPPDPAWVEVTPRDGIGYGATEAPRGMLYHRYQINADGTVAAATIIPPTSQNQRVIESDMRAFVEDRLDLPHDRLTWECEQAVRSYDPCISCATHFLDLRVQRA